MKLHRTSGTPDWTSVDPSRYNFWQRLAAATAGIITPGNIITAIGLLTVLAALSLLMLGRGWPAVAGLVLGRALDLADGLAAEATGTKSPLGEAMDAAVDKLATGLTLVAAGAAGAVVWQFVGLLALPHLVIAIIAIFATRRGRKFHPSRLGKLSMATAWVGLLSLVAVHAAGLGPASSFGILAYAISIISIIMASVAAADYSRQAR